MKSLLALIVLVIAAFAASAAPAAPLPPRRPNIIYILCDDLGYGDLGVFFQNSRARLNDRSKPYTFTPGLNAMAAAGAVLQHHYAPAPVCAPSRASFLLGQSQGHANVRDNQFDKALANNYNVANVLQALGYSTAIIGKWGLQGESENYWPAAPLKRGFNEFFGYMRHVDGHEHYPKESLYRQVKQVWHNGQNIINTLDKCYSGDLWTAYAKQWITTQATNSQKPFFLYLAYDTPHAVLELPAQGYPAGGGLHGGLRWLGTPGHMINTASGTPDSYRYPDYAHATYDHDNNPATPEVPWPDTFVRYATAVRRIDDMVADIRQLLADLNIDKNTLIVFTSDNGPSIESYLPKSYAPNRPDFFGSFGPFDGIKRDTWEGGLRMPALAAWPGHIPAGSQVTAPGSGYDWLATFTQAAGAIAPASSDGLSLLPRLLQHPAPPAAPVYVEYFEEGTTPRFTAFAPEHRGRKRGQMQMLRIGDYTGLRYNITNPAAPFEIYNIIADPQQRDNLAGTAAMHTLQQRMHAYALQNRVTDTSAARPYDSLAVPSAAAVRLIPGLSMRYYAINFPWLPGIENLPAARATHITGLSSPSAKLRRPHTGVYVLTGFINIAAPGYYNFSLSSNTPAFVRLHKAMVLDNDFSFRPHKKITSSVHLSTGYHPITIEYKGTRQSLPQISLQCSAAGGKAINLNKIFFTSASPSSTH